MCSTFVMHQYLGCVIIETKQSLHQLYYRLNIALLYAFISNIMSIKLLRHFLLLFKSLIKLISIFFH